VAGRDLDAGLDHGGRRGTRNAIKRSHRFAGKYAVEVLKHERDLDRAGQALTYGRLHEASGAPNADSSQRALLTLVTMGLCRIRPLADAPQAVRDWEAANRQDRKTKPKAKAEAAAEA